MLNTTLVRTGATSIVWRENAFWRVVRLTIPQLPFAALAVFSEPVHFRHKQ